MRLQPGLEPSGSGDEEVHVIQVQVKAGDPLKSKLDLLVVMAAEGEEVGDRFVEVAPGLVPAIKAGDFTPEEVRRAKAHLLQSFLQNNETNSGKADTIGFYSALGVPDFWKNYPEEIENVTAEDVVAAAEKYLGGGYWGYTLKPRGK